MTHGEILAALQSQPLVVMLEVESPKVMERLVDKPTDAAQYKADVMRYNTRMQQLLPRFWTVSPAIEFRPESALPALLKDRQHATLVLYREQQRLGYTDGRGGTSGVTYLDTKWYLSLAGGKRDVFSFTAPMPLSEITAADIVSALRCLQFQIRGE